MLLFNTTCATTLGIMTRCLIAPPSLENYFTFKVKLRELAFKNKIVSMGGETYTTITTFSLKNMICRR
jgi:hypothetical protein